MVTFLNVIISYFLGQVTGSDSRLRLSQVNVKVSLMIFKWASGHDRYGNLQSIVHL